MGLFVVTVALAIVLGTLATQRAAEWRRTGTVAAALGALGWLAAGAWVAALEGVPPALLVLVAATLTLPVRDATLRTFEPGAVPPLRWLSVASGGVTAAALEGYWGYQTVVIPHTGVDFAAIGLFTALTTLTTAVTGVVALALHMRSVNPDDSPALFPPALRRIAGPGPGAAHARRLAAHARHRLRLAVRPQK